MELYKKYRPDTLKKIVGNKETVNALKRLIENDNLPHAILLTGKTGCGKTTVGRILKNELKVHDWDYKELDTAVFRGIDTVRDIRKQMTLAPVKSAYRIYLWDEIQSLGTGGDSKKNVAQNALLKALEDTPKHVYFILCTTNPEMLLKTIKGRCTEFKMDVLSDKEMKILLTRISKKERKKIPESVIKKITEVTEGHPRNALQLLGKILHLEDEKEMLSLCSVDEIEEQAQVNELCQALLKGHSWGKVSKILKGLSHLGAEELRRSIIRYSNAVLLNGNEDAALILGWFLYKNTYDLGDKDGKAIITQFCWNIVNNIESNC